MRTSIRLTLAVAALALASIAPSAGAATGVTISAANQSGATLSVEGSATFDDQPFLVLGTDGTGDTATPGFDTIGGDLTSASISSATNGDVRFRFVVNEMPPAPLDGSPTGVVHAWDFCVDTELCFEIDGGRNGTTVLPPVVGPYASLWTCADSACAPGGQDPAADLAAAMSAATNSFTVTVPASSISANPGSIISPASGPYAEGPVITDVSDGGLFPLFEIGDGVAALDDYEVARQTVSLALGAPGQDPQGVTYTSSFSPATGGAFSGSVSTAGLTGNQTLYVRACFGSNNCAYATQDVTLA